MQFNKEKHEGKCYNRGVKVLLPKILQVSAFREEKYGLYLLRLFLPVKVNSI